MPSVCFHASFKHRLRKSGAKDKKLIANYVQMAQKRMIHKVCAQLWQVGVPWAEALKLSSAAIKAANPDPKPAAKGKGKGKGPAKGKGRHKGGGKGWGKRWRFWIFNGKSSHFNLKQETCQDISKPESFCFQLETFLLMEIQADPFVFWTRCSNHSFMRIPKP